MSDQNKQPAQPTETDAEKIARAAEQAPPAEATRSCEHTPEEIEEARKRYEKAHPKKS